VRLPENFRSLAPEGSPRVALAAEEGGGKFAALSKIDEVSRILVRRSDHDFNDHVNNVHYVEWALEAVPESFRERLTTCLDIVFRQSAHAGDELESRVEIVDDSTLRHAIVRKSDEALLATAETRWS
jgi:acyl-ACP thioesterase